MIAVIFEFNAAPRRRQEYLGIAAELGKELEGFDGFISIERFQSLKDETKFVSLSFWRVAQVIRDYTRDRRTQTPADSVQIHG